MNDDPPDSKRTAGPGVPEDATEGEDEQEGPASDERRAELDDDERSAPTASDADAESPSDDASDRLGDGAASDANDNDDADPPDQLKDDRPDPPGEPVDRSELKLWLSRRHLTSTLIAYMNATKPLQEADTKDIVQLTFERAMRARKWPKTEAPMVTWLKAITDSAYKDHFRKKGRTDDVEETRADVHEMADAKAPISDIAELTHEEAVKLAAESPENARAFEMLKETRVEDAKVITIARERGLKKNTASHQINSFAEKVRNRVRARLAEIGAAAAVGFAMILLLLHGGGEGTGVGAGRGVPHPSDPLPELPTVLSPQMLRDLAHEYCYEDRYGMCLEYLDRARRLDPAGDIDPRVVEERRRAEIELREHGEKNPR